VINLRIVTCRGVCTLLLAIQPLFAMAEQPVVAPTPLRGAALADAIESEVQLFARPAEQATSPRTPPDLWRNPGSLRTGAGQDRPGTQPATNAPTSTDFGVPDVQTPAGVQPPRTLIQRIRERRLAQLQKQAERLRQLSQRDGLRASEAIPAADPNGAENLDLQIDLGVPADGSPAAEEYVPLIAPSAVSEETPPTWTPSRPSGTVETTAPDSPPSASPSIEIQIDLPEETEPPSSGAAAQGRLRNLWGGSGR
jgi:hypothetical protein